MTPDTDLMRRAERLHWRLLNEAWAAVPGSGAPMAEEKGAYVNGLLEAASWVGMWIWTRSRGGRFDLGRVAEGLDFALATARLRAEALPAERWARGYIRGLERGLVLARRVFPGDEGTAESASEVAERAFFEEAARLLGQGETAGGRSAREREQ